MSTDLPVSYGREYAEPYVPPPDQDEAAEGETAAKIRAGHLSDQLLDAAGLRAMPPPAPLVAGWLYRDSLAWLGGKPGHGKSFVAVDLACSIGTGRPWHGHNTTLGVVLYVIAEGASGLGRRVEAWSLANGTKVDNVWFLPVPVQLMTSLDVSAVSLLLGRLRPALVILDTQARVTVGAEENSSKDMGRFVEALERLRRESGACVLIVHHEPRNGENLRGSTALEGAATSIVRVNKDGNVITVTNPKQKDGTEQTAMMLSLNVLAGSAFVSTEGVGLVAISTQSELALLTLIPNGAWDSRPTKTELMDASGQPKSTFYRSIGALIDKGLVIRSKAGNSVIYSLAADDRQTEIPTVPPESQ